MATYLWYPHDDRTGYDALDALVPAFGAQPAAWVSPKHGELYRVDNNVATAVAGFWEVATDDDLYIIGHGASGYKVLGDAMGRQIDQSEVVRRLDECSLRKDANIRVIVYSCFSANGENCLSERIATRLQQVGFACANRVYGFTKMMSTSARRTADGTRELAANMGTKLSPAWASLDTVRDLVFVHTPPKVY